jgi:hypothetical protein
LDIDAPAASPAPFGIPITAGSANPTNNCRIIRCFGPCFASGARKVVFVPDASGSMIQKFDPMRVELRRSIAGLRPPQSFNVVFFQQADPASIGSSLLFANPDSKRKAFDFMDRVTPAGSTDPLPALRRAFAMNPDLIVLLTDGDFPDNQAVIDECRRLNAARTTRIFTIAFLDRGEDYEKTLKQIAADSGGLFRYVSEEDLDQ